MKSREFPYRNVRFSNEHPAADERGCSSFEAIVVFRIDPARARLIETRRKVGAASTKEARSDANFGANFSPSVLMFSVSAIDRADGGKRPVISALLLIKVSREAGCCVLVQNNRHKARIARLSKKDAA